MMRFVRWTILIICLVILIDFSYYKFVQIEQYETDLPDSVHYLVVLTGGGGRIETGLHFSEKEDVQRVLMSGVYPQTSRLSILGRIEDLSSAAKDKVVIDHESRTTRENALNTKEWTQNHNIEHIALITAHYHIPRALILFQKYIPELDITPVSVYRTEAPFDFYVREYVKYLGVRLEILWDIVNKKAPHIEALS